MDDLPVFKRGSNGNPCIVAPLELIQTMPVRLEFRGGEDEPCHDLIELAGLGRNDSWIAQFRTPPPINQPPMYRRRHPRAGNACKNVLIGLSRRQCAIYEKSIDHGQ